MTAPATFLEESERLGVAFDEGDLDRFERYLSLLLEANRSFNLTAIRDPSEAWTKHILDSLTLMPALAALEDGSRVADVGSGGGAPGLPLAIAMPGICFTLIESTGKKAEFLSRTIEALGLPNVGVVSERAELAGRDAALRERFDAATARALGPLRVALELVSPLVRVGGLALFIKGARADEEIREAGGALEALGCAVIDVLPTPTGRIVVVEKTRPTSKKHPRRPGEPKRAPL